MGEDGTVQGLLELPASRTAVLAWPDRPPPWTRASPRRSFMRQQACRRLGSFFSGKTRSMRAWRAGGDGELGWPVFVKPANMGSSIGISRVADAGGLGGPRRGPAVRRVRHHRGSHPGAGTRIGVLGWPTCGHQSQARSCPATTSTTSKTIHRWHRRPGGAGPSARRSSRGDGASRPGRLPGPPGGQHGPR